MNSNELLMAVCEFIVAPTSKEAIAAKCRMAELMKQLKAELPTTDDVERIAHLVLTEVGAPVHLIGHRYMVEAICIAAREPEAINKLTKYLYPTVAERFDTTSSRAERAIRHVIESAFDNMDSDTQKKYFGSTVLRKSGRVTNGEFITRLSLVVRQKLDE